MPKTKQIESKMLDFPEPFKPVIALKWGSNLERDVIGDKLTRQGEGKPN
jgi:hypothetical protein